MLLRVRKGLQNKTLRLYFSYYTDTAIQIKLLAWLTYMLILWGVIAMKSLSKPPFNQMYKYIHTEHFSENISLAHLMLTIRILNTHTILADSLICKEYLQRLFWKQVLKLCPFWCRNTGALRRVQTALFSYIWRYSSYIHSTHCCKQHTQNYALFWH